MRGRSVLRLAHLRSCETSCRRSTSRDMVQSSFEQVGVYISEDVVSVFCRTAIWFRE
jgi:hypothetical protein